MLVSPGIIQDFSGGLDLVSSLNTMDPRFTPDALNFRISEYGGIEKVLGVDPDSTVWAVDATHDAVSFRTRSGAVNKVVSARATAWSVSTSSTGTNLRTGMAATTDTTFVLYEDKLYGLDPSNDMASWDGVAAAVTTHAPGINTGPKRGLILGIHDNRMFVAPTTSGQTGLRVEWSEPGNFTAAGSWPADNFVELGGTGTNERIIAGMSMPDGLVVFTTGSTYLIYDSATGANSLVDSERGCSSRRSLAVIDGNIYGLTRDGIFVTNGRFPLRIISRRVDPLFVNEKPDLSKATGTHWQGRYLVSFARSGSNRNNLTLEVAVNLEGAPIMALDYDAALWLPSRVLGDSEELLFLSSASPIQYFRAFSDGYRQTHAGGSSWSYGDLSCYYELPPLALGDESHIKRLQRLRVVGRGDLYVGLKRDYEQNAWSTARLEWPTDVQSSEWDAMVWDSGRWGGYELYEGWAKLHGRARRMGLRIYESSRNTYALRNAVGSSPPGKLGGAGVYLIEPFLSSSSRRR